jgi:hypothetical protein
MTDASDRLILSTALSHLRVIARLIESEVLDGPLRDAVRVEVGTYGAITGSHAPRDALIRPGQVEA